MSNDKPIEIVSSGLDLSNKKLLAEILSSFSGPSIQDKDLEGPAKHHARVLSESFTSGVGYLRSSFPNESIRTLMSIVWDLCGSKTVPLALGPSVQSLSFGKMGANGIMFAPVDWVAQIKEDAVYQMGALVFVGSQAVDFYNNLMNTHEEAQTVLLRARMYEAEYLRTIRKTVEGHTFNKYQQGIMKDFPQGIATQPHLFYVSKPFVAPS